MQISGRISRQISLLSLLVLIVPMVVFPKKLGTELVEFSAFYGLLEFVIYGTILTVMFRKLPLLDILKGSAVCLIYRMTMGVAFGLLVTLMYQWNVANAIMTGTFKYLPAIILHVVATPFILKPVLDRLTEDIYDDSSEQDEQQEKSVQTATSSNIVISKDKKPSRPSAPVQAPVKNEYNETGKVKQSSEEHEDGFEKSVRYIGEDGSVKLALVVDHEGLLIANFNRSQFPAEDVAPYAYSILESNSSMLNKFNDDSPTKIEFTFKDNKIVVAYEKTYYLMVVSERTVDDVLNIRINQGLEMIRKHISETYGNEFIGNAESIYV